MGKQVVKRGRGRPPKAKPPQATRPHVPLREIIARCGDGSGKMGSQSLREIILYFCEGNYDATEEDSKLMWELVRISAKSAKLSCDPRDIQRTVDAFAKLKGVNQKNMDQLIRIAQMEQASEGHTGTQVNVQVNINADEQRTRLAAIAQRLGVADVLEPIRPAITTSDS